MIIYKYIKKIINENGELILKDLQVDTDRSSDAEEFVYHREINDVQVYITTQNFLTWSIKFQDPKHEDDYLIFLDCKRK